MEEDEPKERHAEWQCVRSGEYGRGEKKATERVAESSEVRVEVTYCWNGADHTRGDMLRGDTRRRSLKGQHRGTGCARESEEGTKKRGTTARRRHKEASTSPDAIAWQRRQRGRIEVERRATALCGGPTGAASDQQNAPSAPTVTRRQRALHKSEESSCGVERTRSSGDGVEVAQCRQRCDVVCVHCTVTRVRVKG